MFLSVILTFVVLDLTEWYCQNQRTDSCTEDYRSVWRQTHYGVTD